MSHLLSRSSYRALADTLSSSNIKAENYDSEKFRRLLDINITGTFLVAQACGRHMIKAGTGGSIVFIASMSGTIVNYPQEQSCYNASKAALHSYSDTLRLELAPFGVRVVTIVTGGVQSNIARTHRSLPEHSRYAILAKEYEERQTHSQANAVSNEAYARRVVAQVLESPAKTHVWEGGKSWLVWFVTTFLPRSVMVRIEIPMSCLPSRLLLQLTNTLDRTS